MSINAEKFIELIENGKFKKPILYNTNIPNNESQTKYDLENYRFFANSFAFDEVMKCVPSRYIGDN